MSARFRRMAARLWPNTLFGRLAIILFSGLVVAHVLAFVLIALDRLAIEEELGSKYAAADIAEAVAFLDYLKPEERPAWLDRLSRRHWRYVLSDEGELEAEAPKRRQAISRVCGPRWGPTTTRILSTSIHRSDAAGHTHAPEGR